MKNMNLIEKIVILFYITQYSEGNESTEELNRLSSVPEVNSHINVETLCNNTNEADIFLQGWSATNFIFGKIQDEYKRKRIHKCKIKIKTEKNFGFASAIEEMDLGGPGTKYLSDCNDYIQFVSHGKSFLEKVLGKLDIDVLAIDSGKLCGQRSLKGHLSSKKQIIDRGSKTNSFNTNRNSFELTFHQSNRKPFFNNSFNVIVTTFGQGIGRGFCEDMYKCRHDPPACINPKFVCDGHVNCALPKSGSDEIGCESDEEKSFYNPIAVTMIALSAVVAAVLGICILITIICQFRRKPHAGSREEHRHRRREELSSSAANAAPRYESVVLSDGEPPKHQLDCELPPSYDSLFSKEDTDSKNS